MIDGEIILIGGKEYIFPDFTLGALQKIMPLRPIFTDSNNPECLGAVTKAFCIGLKRNYPDMTDEFLADNMVIEEIATMSEVLGRQFEKMAKKKNPETLVPTMSPPTGEISTQELLQPQAGPGSI